MSIDCTINVIYKSNTYLKLEDDVKVYTRFRSLYEDRSRDDTWKTSWPEFRFVSFKIVGVTDVNANNSYNLIIKDVAGHFAVIKHELNETVVKSLPFATYVAKLLILKQFEDINNFKKNTITSVYSFYPLLSISTNMNADFYYIG